MRKPRRHPQRALILPEKGFPTRWPKVGESERRSTAMSNTSPRVANTNLPWSCLIWWCRPRRYFLPSGCGCPEYSASTILSGPAKLIVALYLNEGGIYSGLTKGAFVPDFNLEVPVPLLPIFYKVRLPNTLTWKSLFQHGIGV